MLVQNEVSLTNKVVVLKLVSGEEVIARVVSSDAQKIVIKNPLLMVMMPEDDGVQGMVAFAPWVLGANDNVGLPINLIHVVTHTEARTDAATQYSRAIGEEVAQPKKPALLNPTGRRGGRGR